MQRRSYLPSSNLASLTLAIAVMSAPGAVAHAQADPPDMRSFQFRAQTTKVLPGSSGERNRGWNCTGAIADADQLGRLAIVSTLYQNGCYGDGRYNHSNFKVEQGVITDASGQTRYEAYRVHGPTTKASSFLGSRHSLFYKVPARESYSVYLLSGGNLSKAAVVPAASADPAQFVKLGINASTIVTPEVYVVVPSRIRVSALSPLGAGVEGAKVKRTPVGDVLLYRYRAGGTPFDTRSGFNNGPASFANVYSYPRQLFPVATRAGRGLLWQDAQSLALQMTVFAADLRSSRTRTLSNAGKYLLAAAATDGADTAYFLLIEAGDGARANQARGVRLVAASISTGAARSAVIDGSARGLNITRFGNSNVGSMVHSAGKLHVIVSRTMHRSADGLNHQGAIAVVFDAATLGVLRNHGQTSGHSFENVLILGSGGKAVGIDLGDNYPRGVHLHRFDATRNRSAVVYTFKTEHSASSGGRFPIYAEISGNGKTYYKWSNDNRTYTELGGVVETRDGYVIVFAGEAHNGRALDNSRAKGPLTDSRNIGVVRVRKDFDKHARWGNEVRDALVLTPGPAETGGFYTFGGSWSKQRNKGVVWLTRYANPRTENVSRLKAAGLPGGAVLLLWEKWTASGYVSTYAMKIDAAGNRLTSPVELGPLVRLNRRDDPWVVGNDVYVAAGDRAGKSLEVVRIRVK